MKKLFAVLAAVLLAGMVLASCGGGETEPAQESLAPLERGSVTCVTASDAVYSSYLYVIDDEKALDELVGLYNSVTCAPLAEGEQAPDLLTGTLYMLDFYDAVTDGNYGDPIARLYLSPQGYVMLDDGENILENVRRLTSAFDEERLKALLTEYDSQKTPTFPG